MHQKRIPDPIHTWMKETPGEICLFLIINQKPTAVIKTKQADIEKMRGTIPISLESVLGLTPHGAVLRFRLSFFFDNPKPKVHFIPGKQSESTKIELTYTNPYLADSFLYPDSPEDMKILRLMAAGDHIQIALFNMSMKFQQMKMLPIKPQIRTDIQKHVAIALEHNRKIKTIDRDAAARAYLTEHAV